MPQIEFTMKTRDGPIQGKVTCKIWDGMVHEIHNEVRKQEVLEFTLGWINTQLPT